jgi:hypothetical protein
MEIKLNSFYEIKLKNWSNSERGRIEFNDCLITLYVPLKGSYTFTKDRIEECYYLGDEPECLLNQNY